MARTFAMQCLFNYILITMDALIVFITLIGLAINVAIIVFFFGLCNNVKAIRNLLEYRFEQTKTVLSANNSSSQSDTIFVNFCDSLTKGTLVEINGFGPCAFEGKWSGKYCFYPKKYTSLPDTPYLVKDVEPYLALPASELKNFLMI